MSRMKVVGAAAVLAAIGALAPASGCRGIPRGTTEDIAVGTVKLQATGAGIVKADAQKTVYKVKCSECDFKSFDMTAETPTAVRPYRFDWTCPKCGHEQKVTIRVAAP
ncbi:MAG: hypothetical protein QME60_08275 [Verrucomicrobiota bacterium]|nr:hypothetical protein [Verrucomicrobiota bacterium]